MFPRTKSLLIFGNSSFDGWLKGKGYPCLYCLWPAAFGREPGGEGWSPERIQLPLTPHPLTGRTGRKQKDQDLLLKLGLREESV